MVVLNRPTNDIINIYLLLLTSHRRNPSRARMTILYYQDL